MLKIVEFIKSNPDWKDKIAQAPYFIKVKYESMFGRNLGLFKYNQLSSDFNDEMVRECRGLILDMDSLEPISVPFFKFGNYGESYCPKIDWKSAKILTKIDGSLIMIVRLGDNLLISTSGNIDAKKVSIESLDCPYPSYKDLVLDAFPIKGLSLEYLTQLFEEGYTYMFELTSLYNKVVIPYEGINLTLIGIRDNKSLQEIYIKEHPLSQIFSTPKDYGFKTLYECINAAKKLPYTEEGYVVLDKNFNRIKVKSPAYVEIHHLKGEGILTKKKALKLIQDNELEEFLTYFSEYKDLAYNLKKSYQDLINLLDNDWLMYQSSWFPMDSRKEFVSFVMRNSFCPDFMFAKYDGKYSNAREFLSTRYLDYILNLMEKIKESH